jgi:hypothetical protein
VTHELDHEPERDIDPGRVRRVRLGHGANCSSIGSVIDTLFATATIGAAVFAAVVAALAKEPVTLAGGSQPRPDPEPRGGQPP